MGRVSGGHTCMTGRLKSALYSSALPRDEMQQRDRHWRELLGSSRQVVGIILADVLNELRHEEEVFCVRVRKEHFWGLDSPPSKFRDACYNKNASEFLHDMVMGLALVNIRDSVKCLQTCWVGAVDEGLVVR